MFILQGFFTEFDPHGETMRVDVGINIIALLVSDALNTPIINATPEQGDMPLSAPTKQHTKGCAHDADHDSITSSQPRFPGSTRATSRGTLPVTFLVDDDHVTTKLENLLGILEVL